MYSPSQTNNQLPSISSSSLDILLNEYILKINQDPLSIAVSPFPASPSIFSEGELPTHWSGPLSTGETVLMIINTSKKPMDIKFQWRTIPAFKNSTATMFRFAEVSGREVWRSGSNIGFWYGGVPSHGSLVMVVWEDNGEENIRWDWATGGLVHET
jgi:Alpha galactosidase C-terminal beta sandwich domain